LLESHVDGQAVPASRWNRLVVFKGVDFLMHIGSWRNGVRLLLACLGVLTARARDVQVNSDGVNLRLGPGNDHEVIAQAVKGQPLTVLGEEADWVRVVAPAGIDVWVHGELLDGQTVNFPKLLMRTGPGSHCPAIGELVQGDRVTIRDVEPGTYDLVAKSLSRPLSWTTPVTLAAGDTYRWDLSK